MVRSAISVLGRPKPSASTQCSSNGQIRTTAVCNLFDSSAIASGCAIDDAHPLLSLGVVGVGIMVAHETGWPEAVTRLRLPRNVACGFLALRSSAVDLQRSDSLQLPVWEIQLRSQQRRLRPDPMKHAPSNGALPAPTAKHLVPVALHGFVHPVQRTEISGHAKVGVVTAE